VAQLLGGPRLNVHGTGLDDRGLPVVASELVTPTMWLTAAKTLSRLAELGERTGRVFTLENLNTAVDHPGVPFAKAADTLAVIEAVDNPHARLNLDPYHAQIGEGNLGQLVERALPYIGEIQVADVPGRCEPGTGEIFFPAVAAALDRLGYTGSSAWRGGPLAIPSSRRNASGRPSPLALGGLPDRCPPIARHRVQPPRRSIDRRCWKRFGASLEAPGNGSRDRPEEETMTTSTTVEPEPTGSDSTSRERPSARRKAVAVTGLVALVAAVVLVGIVFPAMLGAAIAIAVAAAIVVLELMRPRRDLQLPPESYWIP